MCSIIIYCGWIMRILRQWKKGAQKCLPIVFMWTRRHLKLTRCSNVFIASSLTTIFCVIYSLTIHIQIRFHIIAFLHIICVVSKVYACLVNVSFWEFQNWEFWSVLWKVQSKQINLKDLLQWRVQLNVEQSRIHFDVSIVCFELTRFNIFLGAWSFSAFLRIIYPSRIL